MKECWDTQGDLRGWQPRKRWVVLFFLKVTTIEFHFMTRLSVYWRETQKPDILAIQGFVVSFRLAVCNWCNLCAFYIISFLAWAWSSCKSFIIGGVVGLIHVEWCGICKKTYCSKVAVSSRDEIFGCHPVMTRLQKARSARCWFALPMMLGCGGYFDTWNCGFPDAASMLMLYGTTIPEELWRLWLPLHRQKGSKRLCHMEKWIKRDHHISTLRYVWMPSVMDHDHVEPRMPKAWKSNFRNQNHSPQLWPAKCDVSSLLIFLKGRHLKSTIVMQTLVDPWRPSTCPP